MKKLLILTVATILLFIVALGIANWFLTPTLVLSPTQIGADYYQFSYHCLAAPADGRVDDGDSFQITIYDRTKHPDECIGRWNFKNGVLESVSK